MAGLMGTRYHLMQKLTHGEAIANSGSCKGHAMHAERASYRKIAAEFKRAGHHDIAARNMDGDIYIGYPEARCLGRVLNCPEGHCSCMMCDIIFQSKGFTRQ
jgi:hypothetical protein